MAVGIGPQTGPRVEWQIAFISEGRIELATAAFTVGPLLRARAQGSLRCRAG
jgi:hypothetical protein